ERRQEKKNEMPHEFSSFSKDAIHFTFVLVSADVYIVLFFNMHFKLNFRASRWRVHGRILLSTEISELERRCLSHIVISCTGGPRGCRRRRQIQPFGSWLAAGFEASRSFAPKEGQCMVSALTPRFDVATRFEVDCPGDNCARTTRPPRALTISAPTI